MRINFNFLKLQLISLNNIKNITIKQKVRHQIGKNINPGL